MKKYKPIISEENKALAYAVGGIVFIYGMYEYITYKIK